LEIGVLPAQKWAALCFGIGSLALTGYIILAVDNPVTGRPGLGGAIDETANVRLLARSLFSNYVYAFELTSLLLVIAVIGAVVLARKPAKELPDEAGR
jgi:NADH-quinone oxidoreductase subunit J